MRLGRRLESATLAVLAGTIVIVACSSSWSVGLRNIAHPLRTTALVILCVLGVAYAAQARRLPRPGAHHALAAALLVLAALSMTWSVDPRHTVVRAGAFGLVVVTAAAIGARAAQEERESRLVLNAVLAGAVAVALIGFAIYAVSPGDAVQAATATTGARYRGVGQSPDTVAMLFAVALPIAGLLVCEAATRLRRVAGLAAFALLAGSIAMSDSRGALAAAVVGLLLAGWLATRRLRRRAWVLVAVAGLAALLAALGSLPRPLSAPAAAHAKNPSANVEPYTPNDAQYRLRLEDEVGYRSGSHAPVGRLLSGSGRLEAWKGAIGQGEDRPVLGYGFGTEATVFVDRYQDFQGGVPENSFIGLFLQLGLVGVALLCALFAALGLFVARGLRDDRNLAAACAGVLGATLTLSLVQSYVYAFGNVATLAVWTAVFVGASKSGLRSV